MNDKEPYIKVMKDGPYLVYGIKDISEKTIITDEKGISVKYGDGEVFEIKTNPVSLCRCGHSKDAPFCDGSHVETKFKGKETAPFSPIADCAETIKGPNLTLMDNENYCAFARFCDANGRIWNLVKIGKEDTDKKTIDEANLCPAGRFLIFDKQGNFIEDEHPQSIAALEDGGLKISGPLWIRGAIRVESENGRSYEVRQKQTLCRCGQSCNKPFCNGAHANTKFKASKKK